MHRTFIRTADGSRGVGFVQEVADICRTETSALMEFVLQSASAPSEHLWDYAELIDDAQSQGYPIHVKSVRRALKVDEADAFGSTYFAPVSDSHRQSFVDRLILPSAESKEWILAFPMCPMLCRPRTLNLEMRIALVARVRMKRNMLRNRWNERMLIL
jgi:hypothetical protein